MGYRAMPRGDRYLMVIHLVFSRKLTTGRKEENILFNDAQITREETRFRHMGYSF